MLWHRLVHRSPRDSNLRISACKLASSGTRFMSLFRLHHYDRLLKKVQLKGGLSNYLCCQTFWKSSYLCLLLVILVMPVIVISGFWWCILSRLCGCLLNLLLPWSTGSQIGQGEREREKKNMLTLSTDLEHRSIADMAAALWQATEAGAPIRSSGQMAVVNAKAQSVDAILSSSMHRDNFADLCWSPQKSWRVTEALFH